MRFTKHLAGLATTTALLASGPFVAHADAAPPGAVAGATAPIATVVAPPATGDYNLTTLSGTTAQLVGRGPTPASPPTCRSSREASTRPTPGTRGTICSRGSRRCSAWTGRPG